MLCSISPVRAMWEDVWNRRGQGSHSRSLLHIQDWPGKSENIYCRAPDMVYFFMPTNKIFFKGMPPEQCIYLVAFVTYCDPIFVISIMPSS